MKQNEHLLLWLALAMALEGKSCIVCGHKYESRESVKVHEPIVGFNSEVVGLEYFWKYVSLT